MIHMPALITHLFESTVQTLNYLLNPYAKQNQTHENIATNSEGNHLQTSLCIMS